MPCARKINAEGRRWAGRVAAFTLLEVLIALAIFALAAVVLGAAYVNVLTAYATLQHGNEFDADLKFIRAGLLAESDPKKAAAGGDCDLPGDRHAHWTADIEDTTTADLFKVTFTCEISGTDLKKPFQSVQTFMLLRPTWSDPATRSKLLDTSKQQILKLNPQ